MNLNDDTPRPEPVTGARPSRAARRAKRSGNPARRGEAAKIDQAAEDTSVWLAKVAAAAAKPLIDAYTQVRRDLPMLSEDFTAAVATNLIAHGVYAPIASAGLVTHETVPYLNRMMVLQNADGMVFGRHAQDDDRWVLLSGPLTDVDGNPFEHTPRAISTDDLLAAWGPLWSGALLGHEQRNALAASYLEARAAAFPEPGVELEDEDERSIARTGRSVCTCDDAVYGEPCPLHGGA